MRPAVAAYYLGVSIGTFRELADAEGIEPLQITRTIKVYLRDDLDAFLDRKAGRESLFVRNPWDDI